MQFISISPKDRTLTDVNIPVSSGPGSDGNEEILSILQSSSITGTLPYLEHTLVGFLLLCRDAVPYLPAPPLGQDITQGQFF